jgi:hypothetical protein
MARNIKLLGGNLAQQLEWIRSNDHSSMRVVGLDCEFAKKKNSIGKTCQVVCQIGASTSDGILRDSYTRK